MIETSTCPGCRGVIEKEDRFCQECGRALSPVAATSPKSILEKLHAFRAEFILLGAVVIYAVSVVCWTDRSELKYLANLPATLLGKNTKSESKSAPQLSTTRGVIAKPSEGSELQRLFSKSQTFPSVTPGAGRAVPADTAATVGAGRALPNNSGTTTTTASAKESQSKAPTPAPPSKKLIAQKQTGPAGTTSDATAESMGNSTADSTAEPSVEIAPERPQTKAKSSKTPKADPKAIADVAEYNRLLADYFARKRPDGDGAETAGEPPSYQEWIAAGRKPYF